jgi:hypothetical protein
MLPRMTPCYCAAPTEHPPQFSTWLASSSQPRSKQRQTFSWSSYLPARSKQWKVTDLHSSYELPPLAACNAALGRHSQPDARKTETKVYRLSLKNKFNINAPSVVVISSQNHPVVSHITNIQGRILSLVQVLIITQQETITYFWCLLLKLI